MTFFERLGGSWGGRPVAAVKLDAEATAEPVPAPKHQVTHGAREGAIQHDSQRRLAALPPLAPPESPRTDSDRQSMQYSRAGARRRRVLATEAAGTQPESDQPTVARAATKASTSTVGRYAEGAVDFRQPRVTDLIPRRRLSLFLVAAALLCVLLGLQNIYGYLFVLPYAGDRQALAAFDLQSPGNIADWCASASMMACAAASLLVFAVRRHRTDDYRGGYFSWVWLAVLFVGCSIWLAAPLRAAAAEAVALLLKRSAADVEAYCVLGALTIVVLAALRMGFEMRDSRAALSLLLLAGGGWATASALRVGLLLPISSLAAMGRVAALLGAQIAMLLAILCYARRTCLEAEGKLAAPVARKKRKSTPEAKALAKTSRRKPKSDDASQAASPTTARTAATPKTLAAASTTAASRTAAATTRAATAPANQSASASSAKGVAASGRPTLSIAAGNAKSNSAAAPSNDDADEDSDEFDGLNKAEKRRLRKLKRRDRRAA